MVKLDGDLSVERFNASLDALQDRLRAKYQGEHARVCSVKGRLVEWRADPRYDPAYAAEDISDRMTRLELYEWQRRHHGQPGAWGPVCWRYDPRLEPLVLAGKRDLVTSAASHAWPDGWGSWERVPPRYISRW